MFNKGALSNRDIKREFGKNIFIYPFKEQNLKGSTYNFTASMCAWIEETNDKKKSKEYKLIVDKNGDIIIPPGKTAIIETEESIFVTGKICGTYNSKVKLCSKGLEHIGTTLDPCYFGTSAIPVHNDTDKPFKIRKNETIVSVMFFYTNSRADNLHDNTPFRNDIFGSVDTESFYTSSGDEGKKQISDEDKKRIIDAIAEWRSCTWRNNKLDLKKQVKNFIKKNDCLKILYRRIFLTILISLIIMSVLIVGMLNLKKDAAWYDICKSIVTMIIPSVSLIVGIWYKSYESNKNMNI